MNRSGFLKGTLGGLFTMNSLSDLKKLSDHLGTEAKPMPVLFVGHGSPMNGIEDNEFSQYWEKLGKQLPQPQAVLCISAHWLTKGTYVTAMEHPKTIHDFGGFPKELFAVQYPAPGSPSLAKETASLIHQTNVGLDHDWGLDHGCWSVVKRMYPDANIPVLQLSIDYHQPGSYHYSLAKELSALRKKGVLILGSGNMVHNLRMVAWDKMNVPNYGYDWAQEMNDTFKKLILSKDHAPLLNYEGMGQAAQLAIPTPDHYYPLIYSLGLQSNKDEVEFFNDRLVGGSLTMTSVKIG
jgi:4,5-DOPA dioxygenase extradiol